MSSKSALDFSHSQSGDRFSALNFDTPAKQSFSRNPILWWNLLSLDAPTVALLWALLFAKTFQARVHPVSLVVLTACVWLIYVLDRVFDGMSVSPGAPISARHEFYLQRRTPMLAVVSVVFASTIWLIIVRMDHAMLQAGLCVTVLVLVYLALVHVLGRRIMRFFPKEMLVGLLFAVGTVLPTWLRSPSERPQIFAVGMMFALLCWLNCIAVEKWEQRRIGNEAVPNSSVERGITRAAVLLAGAATLAFLFTPYFSNIPDAGVSFSTALGALGIAVLDRFGDSFSTEMLRVAADVCMLAPALLIPKLFGL